MPLSAEHMQKVNRFFRLNGVVPDCPYCSMQGWEGGEIVSIPVMDEIGNAQPGNATVLMVQFICNNCGHTTLFDARRLGLLSG
jgi:hypothetical protein